MAFRLLFALIFCFNGLFTSSFNKIISNRIIKYYRTSPKIYMRISQEVQENLIDETIVPQTWRLLSQKALKSNPFKEINSNLSQLFEVRLEDLKSTGEYVKSVSASIYQNTDGVVLRSFLPAIVVLTATTNSLEQTFVFDVVEEILKWYFDSGGRSSRLFLSCDRTLVPLLEGMGFQNTEIDLPSHLASVVPLESEVLTFDPRALRAHCEKRLSKTNAYTLYDIIGRISHDIGNPKESIKHYTSALMENPKSAATFRNLGSAYHATGDMQLAFASYQQAIQLDPEDALVYLKLAYFYEDFATKDWVDAGEHSRRCYEYYLDNVDSNDSSVLTRLGNLLVREHKSEEAIAAYDRALKLDPSLHNLWFNKAHAQIKVGDINGAAESLRRTLELDPSVTAARHMLKALSDEEATATLTADDDYIIDLFNSYAQTYDDHGKKLLYSAPRVIRQELAKIYKAKLAFGDSLGLPVASVPVKPAASTSASDTSSLGAPATVGSSCQSYTSFVNNSLDILDLGCGTGLAGAWLKDYARTLVGVDLSAEMVNVARKKMLYTELSVQSVSEYLNRCNTTYDVVVAADVLSYIGDLSSTFRQATSVLRRGGHFVFTVEAAPPDLTLSERGFRLLRTGRFGYSRQYIDSLVASLGDSFSVSLSRDFSPRLDSGEPVPGFLYILEKVK